MPNPEFSFIPLSVPAYRRANGDRTFENAVSHAIHQGNCTCCPQAILDVVRGAEGRPCLEMPWKCPLSTKAKTPTV